MNKEGGSHIDFSKVYKIKYTANLLPSIGMHMALNKETGKLEVVNEYVMFMAILCK